LALDSLTPMPASSRKKKSAAHSTQALADLLLSSTLLESIPDAIVAVDSQGKIIQTNTQTEQLFGYTRKQLLGQKIEMLVPERYRRQHHQHRDGFVAAPKIRRMGQGLDLYGRKRNGSEFPVEISLSPVATADGTLVLSAIRDISDRKKIEEELRRAHQELDRRMTQQLGEYRSRLASIVDSSEDAIIGKNLDGTIMTWNKGAERIYGYTAEEMIGKNISIIVPKDRPDELPSILEQIARGQSIEHYESTRVTKDGRHLNVSISISPIRGPSGEITGASAIARDMTAQKKSEEHLRRSQKMEAVGRLAGGVAHDFNNILSIINACIELLNDRIAPGSEPVQYIDNIRKAAQRGASLTRQLLAFSRKQVIQPQILDLNERLHDIGKLLRPLMGDDVEILIVPKASSALVEMDPGQLDQVIVNLAVNARDAMPHGGKFILETNVVDLDEEFAAQYQSLKPGKHVLLSVSDNGGGMDSETASRIFEPFFTTKETGKGTGLGLATVYGIVKQSDGHVQVYSEVGHGTSFKIYIPSADHKLDAQTHAAAEAIAPKRHGITILLVEDDDIMRSLTRQMLAEHGYTVLEASDGKIGLELAASHPHIDLVLSDVVMRGMSGPEMVKRLDQSHPNTKVVYMSGYTGELMTEHDGWKRGAPLLEKPFTRPALLDIIHTTLG